MNALRTRVAFLIFSAVLCLAPLPFGSVDELTVAIWVILLGVTAILAIPARPTAAALVFFSFASVVAIAWIVVFHEQVSEHPWLLRDIAHPIWQKSSQLLETTLPASATVVRNQPFFAAGAQMAAFLSLLVGFMLGARQSRARTMLRIVAWSGAVYAVYAVLSFILEPNLVLWREKVAYRNVLTGTFINRNTAAIYFGMCAVLWLLLLFRLRFGPSLRMPAQAQSLAPIRWSLRSRTTWSLASFLLLVSATLMTGSRAGSLLLFIACTGLCLFALRGGGGLGKIMSLAAGLVLAGLVLLQTVGSGLDSRIGTLGLVDNSRLSIHRAVWGMIADRPWLGTGLGTFAWIFPVYRPANVSKWGVWDRAHSTPLEIAAEQGIPFAVLLLVAFLMMIFALAMGVKNQAGGRIYPLAGMLALILAAAHSLIDFSFQIPGLAIVVFGLVGMGLARARAEPADGLSRASTRHNVDNHSR